MEKKNRFILKFSEKTKVELEEIVLSEKHVLKAKEAAKHLLKNKSFIHIETLTETNNNQKRKNEIKTNQSISPFNLDLFIKTLSYRELLSNFICPFVNMFYSFKRFLSGL